MPKRSKKEIAINLASKQLRKAYDLLNKAENIECSDEEASRLEEINDELHYSKLATRSAIRTSSSAVGWLKEATSS